MIYVLLRYALLVGVCATLGLMPYAPEPHLFEKLRMVYAGSSMSPVDAFDLFLHGAPWGALVAMTLTDFGLHLRRRAQASSEGTGS